MKKESIIIKYEGQDHQIDSNTLINTLIHYNAIINEINQVVGDGEREIKLRVNALEKGSFVIDISLVENLIDSIFSSESVNYIAGIVTIVGGVFGAYKFFKGKPVNENDKILNEIIEESNKINNTDISVNVLCKVYNGQKLRASISKSIETASSDTAISGIKLISNNHELADIDKSEFSDLIYDDFDKEFEIEEIKHVVVKNVNLGIITLSFEKRKNWEFMYDGFKINMPMKDSNLTTLIDNGMRFAKGDSIVVNLEITKEYNKEYNVYQNKKYRIVEFIKHIPRPESKNMFYD